MIYTYCYGFIQGGDLQMSKRLIERIGMAAVIAALVAYFCYQVAYGMSETITNGNVTATVTAPPGSKVNNFTIVPEGKTSYAYPPPTITYSYEPGNDPHCPNCYFETLAIHDGPYVYRVQWVG